MQYRKFGNTDVCVSALGFGTMRLPQTPAGEIDRPEAIRILRNAIDNGLNYIDTAYRYHQGESEPLVGEALKDGYRQKVLLASKMPVWMVEQPEDFDRIFEDQLNRLGVEKIDMYLMHALNAEAWDKICKFGLMEKAMARKAAGQIGHIGFSFHDSFEVFERILNGFDGWEFCQLQYNYVDIENQAGEKGLQMAADRGLAVIVMEPLLGGKLATPPAHLAHVFGPEKTPVEWALDFLWNDPRISLLLSGMSNWAQVEENMLYAHRSSVGMLDDSQLAQFAKARKTYLTMSKVPCTKCAYCMPCPFGVDIPGVFEAYNQWGVHKKQGQEKYTSLSEADATLCKACGKCQKVCPQQIAIPQMLQQAHKDIPTE